MNKNIKGFTLVELIVVITIIAIVTALTLVNFGGVNRKSRDGRRMADLEKYRVSLEMARQVGTTYPQTLDDLVSMGLLQALASDPKGGSYLYTVGSPAFTYTLMGKMEDLGSTTGSYGAGCGGTCNYQVVNP